MFRFSDQRRPQGSPLAASCGAAWRVVESSALWFCVCAAFVSCWLVVARFVFSATGSIRLGFVVFWALHAFIGTGVRRLFRDAPGAASSCDESRERAG